MSSKNGVELKLNFIGTVGSGKTSILNRYVHSFFMNDYHNTLGAALNVKTIQLDKTRVRLQIWDIGGQDRFQSLMSGFYKGSDGCFLVYDVTNRETFECLEKLRNDFLDKVHTSAEDFPMIILGNKIDLADREVSKKSADDWCSQRSIPYFEVSAKLDINVDLAFETLARKAYQHYQEVRESYLTDSFKLTPIEDDYRRRCC
uniref:Ras-related protein Rab-7b n=1 Tax=Leptobrachium leishanense TaxID=445787 RepID=A0A8C5LVI8_9ANUR